MCICYRKDFHYMTEEAKRIMSLHKESFVDRVFTSVERHYTVIKLEQELRKSLLGKRGADKTSAASMPTNTESYSSNRGLVSAGVGGCIPMSLLGPGQYCKTDVPSARGVVTLSPQARRIPGAQGYSFSTIPRSGVQPIPRIPRHFSHTALGDKKSDSKTTTPVVNMYIYE